MNIADRLKRIHKIFATAEKPGVAFAAAHIVVRRLSDGQAVTMVDELAQLAQIAVLAESLEIGEWPDPLPPDTVREIVEGIGFDEVLRFLGVSPRTLESWIYGERNCTGPARKLLATEAVARGLEPG